MSAISKIAWLARGIFFVGVLVVFGCGDNRSRDAWSVGPVVTQASVAMKFAASEAPFELGVCVREFRLYSAERKSRPVRIVVPVDREIQVSAAGTQLATLEKVPPGEYHTVEMILDSHCQSSKSARVMHSGAYQSTDSEIKLRFKGSKIIDGSTASINLGVRPLLTALEDLPVELKEDPIKWCLEHVEGSF